MHGVETTYTAGADGSLSTTADDNVGLAKTDLVECSCQRIARRSTGGGRRIVRTVESEVDADLSSCDVRNHLRDEERIELGTVLRMGCIVAHLILEGLDTADAHTIDDTDAVLVGRLQVDCRILYTLDGTDHCQLGVAVELAGLLAVNVIIDVQAFDLTGELRLELGCIETCNRSCTALPCQHVLPGLLRSVTQRSNGAQTCYDYSF